MAQDLYIFNNFIRNTAGWEDNAVYWQRNPLTHVWEKKAVPPSPPEQWIESHWLHVSLQGASVDGLDTGLEVNDRVLWRGLWVEGPLTSTPSNIGEWDKDAAAWVLPAPIPVDTTARAYPISIVPHYIAGHFYLVGEDVLHWDGATSITTISPTPPSWAFRSVGAVTDFTLSPVNMIQTAIVLTPTYLYAGVDFVFLLDGSYWFYSQGEYQNDSGETFHPAVLMGTPTRGAVLDDPSVLTGTSLYKIFSTAPTYISPSGGPAGGFVMPKAWGAYMWLAADKIAPYSPPAGSDFDVLYLMMDGTPRLDTAFTLSVPTVPAAFNQFANFYVHPTTNDVYVMHYSDVPGSGVTLNVERLSSYNLASTPATFTWTTLSSFAVPKSQTQPRVTSDDEALYILNHQVALSRETKVYRVDMTTGAVTEETVEWTEDEGPLPIDSHFFRGLPIEVVLAWSFGIVLGL